MKEMEDQNLGKIDKPGGGKRPRFNFEFEAAETLACLAHPSQPRDEADLVPAEVLSFADKRVISPEKKQSRENPQGSRRAVHQFCFTTPSLTEADREAKKMRRMLANRESARQTIRRRQIIFEELTRKAAALELENENLRRQKEEKMRDYLALKETNDALKKVMVEFNVPQEPVPEPEPELAPEPDPEPTECPISGTPATTALLLPPQGQPSPVPLSLQSDYPNSAAVFHISEAWRQCLLNDSGTSSSYVPNPGGGGALLYVLQLLPNPLQNAGPSESSNPAQTHLCHQCGAAAASGSSTPSINRGDVGKAVEEKPCDPDKGALLSMPLNHVETSCASGSGMGRVGVDFQVQSSSEETMPAGWTIAKNAQKHGPVPDQMEWLANVGTPAQARKRRRELMKMKSLRLGQFTMN